MLSVGFLQPKSNSSKVFHWHSTLIKQRSKDNYLWFRKLLLSSDLWLASYELFCLVYFFNGILIPNVKGLNHSFIGKRFPPPPLKYCLKNISLSHFQWDKCLLLIFLYFCLVHATFHPFTGCHLFDQIPLKLPCCSALSCLCNFFCPAAGVFFPSTYFSPPSVAQELTL